MAEKLCELRKKGGGGGKYTETSLWTNSAPTSSYSGGDVTLSESVEQYKYIKIKCRVSSSNAGTFSTIYSVDDLKTFMANSVSSGCGHIAIYDSSNNRHSRGIQYKDSTTINIKVAYQDGTTTQNNANCIPIEILGLNELAHSNVADFATLSISQGSANPTGHGYTTNSSIFTVSYEDASSPRTGTITVNKTGTYVVSAAARNRGSCTPSIKKDGVVWVDNNQYYTSTVKGIRDEEIQITAGTVFLLDPTATTGATGYTSLVIAKK